MVSLVGDRWDSGCVVIKQDLRHNDPCENSHSTTSPHFLPIGGFQAQLQILRKSVRQNDDPELLFF